MDLDTSRLDPFRLDAYRFLVGTLWLVALGAFFVTPEAVSGVLRYLDARAAEMPHLSVPPFVIGFGAVLTGVAVPYCLSAVLWPVANAIANWELRIHVRLAKVDTKVAELTAARVVRELDLPVGLTHNNRVAVLSALDPRLAQEARAVRHRLEFLAASAIPAAMILGWLVYHALQSVVSPVFAVAVAVLLGTGLQVLATRNTDRAFFGWISDTDVMVLVALRRLPRSDSTSVQH